MNCRTFHKCLEDYLEEKLDFAARFALERHARQCVHCERELASARDLSRMVHDLERVKAPANFETSVLNEIATRKIHRRFSLFRRLTAFDFDLAYWRKYALAVSGCIVLVLGIFYWYGLEPGRTPQELALSSNATIDSMEDLPTGTDNSHARFGEGFYLRFQTDESDYRDYLAIGQDDQPMFVPLPNTIQLQISPPSEEYYINNVSH